MKKKKQTPEKFVRKSTGLFPLSVDVDEKSFKKFDKLKLATHIPKRYLIEEGLDLLCQKYKEQLKEFEKND